MKWVLRRVLLFFRSHGKKPISYLDWSCSLLHKLDQILQLIGVLKSSESEGDRMTRARIEVLFLGGLLSILLVIPLLMMLFRISLVQTEDGVLKFIALSLYFVFCSLVAIRFATWKSSEWWSDPHHENAWRFLIESIVKQRNMSLPIDDSSDFSCSDYQPCYSKV